MRQKRQGGSTVGYILIGIVLIGALVGGVYTLRRVTSEKPAEVSQASKEQDEPRPENPNAWLEPLIGAGCSTGPTNVSANKHSYLAEAALHEAPKPDPA